MASYTKYAISYTFISCDTYIYVDVILKFEFMDELVTWSLAPWFKSDSKAFSSWKPNIDILCDEIAASCESSNRRHMYVTISALTNVVATRAHAKRYNSMKLMSEINVSRWNPRGILHRSTFAKFPPPPDKIMQIPPTNPFQFSSELPPTYQKHHCMWFDCRNTRPTASCKNFINASKPNTNVVQGLLLIFWCFWATGKLDDVQALHARMSAFTPLRLIGSVSHSTRFLDFAQFFSSSSSWLGLTC